MKISKELCQACGVTTIHHGSKCLGCAEASHRSKDKEWDRMSPRERVDCLRKRIEAVELEVLKLS